MSQATTKPVRHIHTYHGVEDTLSAARLFGAHLGLMGHTSEIVEIEHEGGGHRVISDLPEEVRLVDFVQDPPPGWGSVGTDCGD